jgi:predicted metal-dependent peptidase
MNQKLSDLIQKFIIDPQLKFEFWGEFSLFINFHSSETIPTAGVCHAVRGPQYYYNEKFVNGLNEKQLTFLHVHELSHLLWNHIYRTGERNKKLANIAQDMIINTIIKRSFGDITEEPVKAFYIPEEYKGSEIFEELYEWLLEQKDKQDRGEKIPQSAKNALDAAKDYVFDVHLDDEIDAGAREEFIKDIINNLKARGFVSQDIENFLQTIRPSRKDYLREIKRSISQMKGKVKQKSLRRPNRRGIDGLKGRQKYGCKLNVVLDVSGSMGGDLEHVLSFIFQDDLEMNLVQCDAEIQAHIGIHNKKQIQKMKVKGFGGTVLQPAIDHLREKFPQYNTVVLTDGYTDDLDLRGIGRKNLVISCGVKPNVQNAKVIVIEKTT